MAERAEKASNASGFDMATNVPPGGTAFNFRAYRSEHVRPKSEDETLGQLWGCTPKAAHTLKCHAARRAADVIRLRRARGDHEGAARYAEPLELVLAALPCPDAEKREGLTDATEDYLQAVYRDNPCEATARPLLRMRATMRAASIDHDLEIAKQWGIEP